MPNNQGRLLITARQFSEGDLPYEWVSIWLTNQPSYKSPRKFEVSVRRSYNDYAYHSGYGDDHYGGGGGSDGKESKDDVKYKPLSKSSTVSVYRGHLMRVTRDVIDNYYDTQETLHVTIFTLNAAIMDTFIREARAMHNEIHKDTITTYTAGNGGSSWRVMQTRSKRPFKSVVLDEHIKLDLLRDATEYLKSQSWYKRRGIPWRRGYLLYGEPGAGKSSTVAAMAGELGLDIYTVSLSKMGLDDSTFADLIACTRAPCIILIEDIDVAFSRDDDNGGNGGDFKGRKSAKIKKNADMYEDKGGFGGGGGQNGNKNNVTLSGILNAIDGVSSPEGRILMATTNRIDALDDALTRPGRLDVKIQYELATQSQIKQLFINFFYGNEIDESLLQSGKKAKRKKFEGIAGESNIVLESNLLKAANIQVDGRADIETSLEETTILASAFSVKIPSKEFSIAQIQGWLMMYKHLPEKAVEAAETMVADERKRLLAKRQKGEAELEKAIERKAARRQKKKELKLKHKLDDAADAAVPSDTNKSVEPAGEKSPTDADTKSLDPPLTNGVKKITEPSDLPETQRVKLTSHSPASSSSSESEGDSSDNSDSD